MQDGRNNLVVYRASAGSGKTHELTGEYLALLFGDDYAYRHILAVTFTNKATDEMKTRIIEELAKLSSNKDSGYVSKLTTRLNISEEKLRTKAQQILVYILHDYSSFSVSTIDRFFQQTLRAFTRELGLNGGYNVELDSAKVLSEAIDLMLADLDGPNNEQLLEWLIQFSEEKIENSKTWNIRKDIIDFSGEIFKEVFKQFSKEIQEDIANKDLVASYKKKLTQLITQHENKTVAIAKRALAIIEHASLETSDFKNGAKSPFHTQFSPWARGEQKDFTNTFLKLPNNVDEWYKKNDKNEDRIKQAYADGLNDCVCEMVDHQQNAIEYKTACEINHYFFTLGILGDVDKKVREYTAENNVMLIADTTKLLNEIIQGDNTPFIYEKIATRIDHYLIDEFQDTSGLQWANFMPLLKDSLDAGKRNLIVGDVKQSIYRWRNSDWNLLDEQLDKDFRIQGIDNQSLTVNRRSARNVINFNNTIFAMGAKVVHQIYCDAVGENVVRDKRVADLAEKIKRAYKDSYQQIPPNVVLEEGHVQVNFIDEEKAKDWKLTVLETLPTTIEELQDKGYALKDIAILVRTKKEGAEVANCLLQYKNDHLETKYRYDIISDDSLFLGKARSIKLIISLMKYLRTPANPSLRAMAIYEYFRFKDQLTPEEALQKHFSIDQVFPNDIAIELRRISELPLYEMTEELFNLFYAAINENENIYIQSFLDCVLDYSIRYSSDLDSFLRWWDENGIKKTIFTPDGQDAIRIMTIHKAKGLGFNVVIIPFCDWDLESKSILWCQPSCPPFNQMHLVPVKYSKKLANTIFEYEYYREKMHSLIDNLNILYVAFTRVKKELIVFAPKPTNKKVISNISSLLWASINEPITNSEVYTDLTRYIDPETNQLNLGVEYIPVISRDTPSSGSIAIKSAPTISFEDRLKLKLNNKYYFTEQGLRQYGTMMHEIISKVNLIEDLENAIDDYCQSGDITTPQKREIVALLTNYMQKEEVKKWYLGEYKTLNEAQILQSQGRSIRPDRIMIKGKDAIIIDYKFGEKEDKKYIRQVKTYMTQVAKMGYTVSGFICYITLDKIIEIKDTTD